LAGTLFIIATPIGNLKDLTLRAQRFLSKVDFLVCEEFKFGKRILRNLNLDKEIYLLNEHNEAENAPDIIQKILQGKNCALISDAGTPIFSDPGHHLTSLAIKNGIIISPIPGPDSLIPSLVASGFDISKFFYAGWLSPKKEKRISELEKLKGIKKTIAIMETPYRLRQLLQDVKETFGEGIEISLSCDLTTEKENSFRGTLSSVTKKISELKEKFEFVLVINNNKK
jgi:16S rRNA (cytidine1402-2'-O)-methyltransferase